MAATASPSEVSPLRQVHSDHLRCDSCEFSDGPFRSHLVERSCRSEGHVLAASSDVDIRHRATGSIRLRECVAAAINSLLRGNSVEVRMTMMMMAIQHVSRPCNAELGQTLLKDSVCRFGPIRCPSSVRIPLFSLVGGIPRSISKAPTAHNLVNVSTHG